MTRLVDADDLVGLAEAAERAGVSRQTIVNWRIRRADFPQPAAVLACGPIWLWDEINAWLDVRHERVQPPYERHGRPVSGSQWLQQPHRKRTHERDVPI